MKKEISIIQDQQVLKYNNSYYRTNISEFTKYLNIFSEINYLATVQDVSALESVKKIQDKVHIVNLPLKYKLNILFLSDEIKRVLDDLVYRSDLLIIKMPSLGLSQYVINQCLKYKKEFVLEVVGCAWSSYWYYSKVGKLIAPYSLYINKKYIRKSNNTIYVTQSYLQNRYPSAGGKTIGCSNVEITNFRENSKKWIFESLNNYELKIATISPIDIKFRGHIDVLKVLRKMKCAGYKFKYFLIGSGSKKRLRSIVRKFNLESEVVFLGVMDHSSLLENLDSYDLYIHPSKAEGLPRSLIEAMSRALPCIAANTAGNPELLESAYIYNKGDVKNLYKIMTNLTAETLNMMSRYNLSKSKKYEYKILCDRRIEFFKEINSEILIKK